VELEAAPQNVLLKGIVPELASQHAEVRRAALQAISRLKNINFVDGTDKLMRALSDKDAKVRVAAC
jgi:hypothetical protein